VYVPTKTPKNPTKQPKSTPHPSKKNPLSESGPLRKTAIVPPHYDYLIIFFTFAFNVNNLKHIAMRVNGIKNSIYGGYAGGEGLTMKNGRLINNRPCGETGIAEMARARKMAKREEKVSMIAEGYSRGEMMSEVKENIMSQFKIKL
jgi:hypothetical protein